MKSLKKIKNIKLYFLINQLVGFLDEYINNKHYIGIISAIDLNWQK